MIYQLDFAGTSFDETSDIQKTDKSQP